MRSSTRISSRIGSNASCCTARLPTSCAPRWVKFCPQERLCCCIQGPSRLFRGRMSGRRALLAFAAVSTGLVLSNPAFASDITVGAPVSGTSVGSPVWVRAHNVGCNGQAPSAFGYSIDNSSTFTRGVTSYDIDTKAAISAGTHTIHFKSWVNGAACPMVSATFKVGGSSSGSTSDSSTGSSSAAVSSLPSYAIASATLDGIGGWSGEHDSGTPGSSRGSMSYPATISSYDHARKFYMTYSNQRRRTLARVLR